MRVSRSLSTAALALTLVTGCSGGSATPPAPATQGAVGLSQQSLFQTHINHIIVISQENWSFDGLYQNFPGANGLGNALGTFSQVDNSGNPIKTLPPMLNGAAPDPNFTAVGGQPTAPFNLAIYQSITNPNLIIPDTNHNFWLQQYEIDGGKLDRYLAPLQPTSGSNGSTTLGYWDLYNGGTPLPEAAAAKAYVLDDNFHQSTFGGSFLNNMWAFCACTPTVPGGYAKYPNLAEPSPDPVTGFPPYASLGAPEGQIIPGDYGVNTMYSVAMYPPVAAAAWPGVSAARAVVPLQTQATIGDRLTGAGISWTWYSEGLNEAMKGNADSYIFQAHHQSPMFFANFAPGSAGFKAHIKDIGTATDANTSFASTLLADLASGSFPQYAFIKLSGANNEHPGYADLYVGQLKVNQLINAIQMSPVWKDSMIVIYYDEAGGHYDHVPPAPVDRWGPATRVPAIVISPWAKRGYVDHTNYEVVSILSTLEMRFGLAPLNGRDAAATALIYGMDFSQTQSQALGKRQLLAFPQLPPPPKVKPGTTEVNDTPGEEQYIDE